MKPPKPPKEVQKKIVEHHYYHHNVDKAEVQVKDSLVEENKEEVGLKALGQDLERELQGVHREWNRH